MADEDLHYMPARVDATPIRWKIHGIGRYGSDIEVVAADVFDSLQQQHNRLIESLQRHYAECPGSSKNFAAAHFAEGEPRGEDDDG